MPFVQGKAAVEMSILGPCWSGFLLFVNHSSQGIDRRKTEEGKKITKLGAFFFIPLLNFSFGVVLPCQSQKESEFWSKTPDSRRPGKASHSTSGSSERISQLNTPFSVLPRSSVKTQQLSLPVLTKDFTPFSLLYGNMNLGDNLSFKIKSWFILLPSPLLGKGRLQTNNYRKKMRRWGTPDHMCFFGVGLSFLPSVASSFCQPHLTLRDWGHRSVPASISAAGVTHCLGQVPTLWTNLSFPFASHLSLLERAESGRLKWSGLPWPTPCLV